MQIYYWSPFLTNIATINSVKRSAIALKKYSKKKLDISIINSCGEWSFFKENSFGIKIINILNFNLHKFLPKEGFVQSRFSFIIIFLTNIFPLFYKVKKRKPDFLVIHLLTLLPILLSPLIYKKTKIVLRISGLPEMNFFRKFVWKTFSKYIYLVTTPTKLTANDLIGLKIFNNDKVKILRDPIIIFKEINNKKKEAIEDKIFNENYYISIGRLTDQKNFEFLIDVFSKNLDKFNIKKLFIIGKGENYLTLNKQIKKNNMENNIYLLGFKKNVYKYIYKSSGMISVASYEDPGFALIESAFLKKKIVSSLVRNGPKEMHLEGNVGYFFKYNNEKDFIEKLQASENNDNLNKIKNALKLSKHFTNFSHCKQFEKYLVH